MMGPSLPSSFPSRMMEETRHRYDPCCASEAHCRSVEDPWRKQGQGESTDMEKEGEWAVQEGL